ncbi:unnamed protein product [Mytilus coruscus]|uniref:Reverse transcriptase domain-containing protein n=1 Tax=Mytilus coruscus TaxID=42192 RepID=A0A6J8CFY0_MYTCO|nr:unnamed protein product [Mytilus coruscus]
MYNYEGARIPLDTHLNIDFFKFMLSDYHDRDICALLEFGFPVGYDYKEHFRGASCTVQNHQGAIQFSNDIDKFLRKEIEKKALLGPFHSNPFSHEIIISPLNSVPKIDTVERRVILDLSTHGGGGVNGGINKDLYLGVDEIIKSKGPGCLCFKQDLHESCLSPNIYRSARCSFTAHICQRFTNAVAYIYRLLGFDIINYLDDFAGAETSENAFKAFKELENLFLSCGIEESTHKAFSPSHRMEFLGIICDTVKLTLEIPDDKLKDIRSILGSWECKQSAKLRDIQSLIDVQFKQLARDVKKSTKSAFASNLVPHSVVSFDCKRQLTRGKVFMYERVAIVVFEWTKTIQCGDRILKIPLVKIDDSILCPVTAYNRLCRMIPAPEESPAFVIKRNASLKTV